MRGFERNGERRKEKQFRKECCLSEMPFTSVCFSRAMSDHYAFPVRVTPPASVMSRVEQVNTFQGAWGRRVTERHVPLTPHTSPWKPPPIASYRDFPLSGRTGVVTQQHTGKTPSPLRGMLH